VAPVRPATPSPSEEVTLPELRAVTQPERRSAFSTPIEHVVVTPDPHKVAVRPKRPPVLGRYALGDELGRGATARVYQAFDPLWGRRVAIKLMRTPSGSDAARLTAFDNEALILRALHHRNIVPLLDSGTSQAGEPFLVMPLLPGEDLRTLLNLLRARSPDEIDAWPLRRRIETFLGICAGVAHAHSKGIVHRDLKPGNVMFSDDGKPLVVDWGLAGPPRRPSSKGTTGKVLIGGGTPGYMSPEQIRFGTRAVDQRSDVWALGAVLFELLTLQRAVPGGVLQRLNRTIERPPTAARIRVPDIDVPRALSAICAQAMSTKPRDRFRSVAELADAVRSSGGRAARCPDGVEFERL
jgi:eukaryotic-like serine/threonine-protein kinase